MHTSEELRRAAGRGPRTADSLPAGRRHGSPLDAVAELELTFSQARTLLALDRLGGSASVGKLAERLPLSQGATSRVVESLQRIGLVERQEDRRRQARQARADHRRRARDGGSLRGVSRGQDGGRCASSSRCSIPPTGRPSRELLERIMALDPLRELA